MKNTLPIIPMRTTPYLWILLMSIMLSASSCEKEKVVEPEPDLPPLTTKGAMTFGCYVNGEPWVAKVPPFQPYHRPNGAGLNLNTQWTTVWGNIINEERFEVLRFIFFLDTSSINLPQQYKHEYFPQAYINYYNIKCNDQKGDYQHELDTTYNNRTEIIHFDMEKRIMSGTFEFRTISMECRDTVLFTDGRFDVKFTIVE